MATDKPPGSASPENPSEEFLQELRQLQAQIRRVRDDQIDRIRQVLLEADLPLLYELCNTVIALSDVQQPIRYLARILGAPERRAIEVAMAVRRDLGEYAELAHRAAALLRVKAENDLPISQILDEYLAEIDVRGTDTRVIQLNKLFSKLQISQLLQAYQQAKQHGQQVNPALVAVLQPWVEELQRRATALELPSLDLSYLAYVLEASFGRHNA